MKAPIFHQDMQDISRERKMTFNAKRKAEFAAAQTEVKKTKRNRKAPMKPEVRIYYCIRCQLIPCLCIQLFTLIHIPFHTTHFISTGCCGHV